MYADGLEEEQSELEKRLGGRLDADADQRPVASTSASGSVGGGEASEGGEDLLNRLWSTKVVEFPRELVQSRRRHHQVQDEQPLRRRPDAALRAGTGGLGSLLDAGGMYADAISNDNEDDGAAAEAEAERVESDRRVEDRQVTKERLRQGDETALRTTALFVTSKEISQLNTRQILSTVGHAFNSAANPLARLTKEVVPDALEWVNDESIVLLFRSDDDALQAFYELTTRELDPDAPLEWHEILTLPEELEPFYVRAALASDVKQKGAARQSQFYAKQRGRGGAGGHHRKEHRMNPYDRPTRPRHALDRTRGTDPFEEYLDRKRKGEVAAGPGERWQKNDVEDLDAELDAYRQQADEVAPAARAVVADAEMQST